MTFRNFVASPLLHFFLLGGLIFAVYYALNPSPDTGPADEITVSEAQAEVLADKFRAVWGRPPTEAELTQLMANWVTEEAFVREAEALGLDRGDAVIRQRLNQKMQFLIETGAAALTPDDAELQAYLDENADRFTKAPHFAFEQIMLPKIGAAEAAHAVMKEGADPASVRTATILPHSVSLSPAWSIDRDFGEDLPRHWQACRTAVGRARSRAAMARFLSGSTSGRPPNCPRLMISAMRLSRSGAA